MLTRALGLEMLMHHAHKCKQYDRSNVIHYETNMHVGVSQVLVRDDQGLVLAAQC